jgi:hypothetical protein
MKEQVEKIRKSFRSVGLYNIEEYDVNYLLTYIDQLQIENDSLHIVKDEMGRRNCRLHDEIKKWEKLDRYTTKLLKQEGE